MVDTDKTISLHHNGRPYSDGSTGRDLWLAQTKLYLYITTDGHILTAPRVEIYGWHRQNYILDLWLAEKDKSNPLLHDGRPYSDCALRMVGGMRQNYIFISKRPYHILTGRIYQTFVPLCDRQKRLSLSYK